MPILEPMEYCRCFGFRKGRKYRGSDSMQKLQPSRTSTDPELPSGSKPEASVATDGVAGNKTRTFTFRELATATNNFRQESLIGEGGFGAVYKGKIEGLDQVVAVKMLNKSGLQGNKEFLVEVLMLSLLCHPNLVNMIGYCAEGDQRLLVYEFLPLGSLERHLHDLPPDKEPLDWNTRMKIACGAAKGLSYLHHEAQPPVIYRDLKSSNILLDEGFYPKLSDFGFAKFGPVEDKSHVSTRVMGTHGYCAPEYATTGKLTIKSDTYSFGVVLLELITGQFAIDPTRGHGKKMLVDRVLPILKDPKNYPRLADPRLKGQFPESALHHAIELASMCVRENANARPLMKEVVLALDYLVAHPYDPNADKDSRKRGVRTSENGADLKGPEKETIEVGKELNSTIDREQAVAEAKKWGESWRDMKEKGQSSSCNS